ncbi:MAG: FecR family protein [Porticoccaceae bacterium]
MDELSKKMLEEAAIWQARLQDVASNSAEEQKLHADFNQWLKADPRHRQAYVEMEALWGALENPVEKAMAAQPEESGRQTVAHSSSSNAVLVQTRLSVNRLAVAACLVLALCVTVGWQQDWATRWRSDHVTIAGERKSVIADDGSRITLNTDSALAMNYGAEERRVRLLKGEAWFDVAAGDRRSFVVTTTAGEVRVTGTRFNVRMSGDGALVSLDEGRVELRMPDMTSEAPVVLMPGQQALLTGNHISEPLAFDRTAVTAWLRGQFVFYKTPLSEVVDTLNRHRRGRILIARQELNDLEVSGIFSTLDPDAALQAIVGTLPVQQTRLTDYLVLLR